MTARRPSIPAIHPTDPANHRLLSALKERFELLAGERGTKIAQLPPTATLAQVIEGFNNLLTLLQG